MCSHIFGKKNRGKCAHYTQENMVFGSVISRYSLHSVTVFVCFCYTESEPKKGVQFNETVQVKTIKQMEPVEIEEDKIDR